MRSGKIQLNMDRVLSEEEGSVYDPYFGDAYWWGDPESPLSRELTSVKANRAGKNLLEFCTVFNGGMLRLGVPEQAEGAIEATSHPIGTIVKTVEETTLRTADIKKIDNPGAVFVASAWDAGFTVAKLMGNQGFATYSRSAAWSASAESKSGELAFFPLVVDTDSSYSIGLDTDLYPCVQVIGSKPSSGSSRLTQGTTTALDGQGVVMYGRNLKNTVYQPLPIPKTKYFFPGNPSFR